MGTYTGTNAADTITPDTVSAHVTSVPAHSKPSDAADTICGLGGNDDLDGGGGPDVISGGAGNDHVTFHGAGSIAHGGAGNDSLVYLTEENTVFGAAYGDDGSDRIDFYADGVNPTGTVVLDGGAGDDFIESLGVSESDYTGITNFASGGPGNDSLRAFADFTFSVAWPYEAGNNDDYLFGGPGDDSYFVLEPRDVVVEKANEGYDKVEVWDTDYTLPANVEKLTVSFLAANDLAFRFNGNELDNVILDANGNDTIHGLGGNDTIHGDGGNDYLDGGPGADALYGDEDNDKLFGQNGDDQMYGGTGNDEMGGQAGNDTMFGGLGNDKLGGGTGNDRLYGDAGDDLLAGREGSDHISGGAGNDTFDYYAATDSGKGSAHDVISDFTGIHAHGGDRIDLAKIDADVTRGGNQAFTFVGTMHDLKAGQLHVVAGGGTGSLVQGEVDGKAGYDFEILVQDGATKPGDWVGGDFIL